MRNLPSALICIVFVYMTYTYGFHWIFITLILGAIILLEWPSKESKELIQAQIRNLDAGTVNLKLVAVANRTTTEANVRLIDTINMMRRKMGL